MAIKSSFQNITVIKHMSIFSRLFLFLLALCNIAFSGESKLIIHSISFDDDGAPSGIAGELLGPSGSLPHLLIRLRDRDIIINLPIKSEVLLDGNIKKKRFSVNFITLLRENVGKPGKQWELGSLKGDRKEGGLKVPLEGITIYKDEKVSVILRMPSE